MTHERCCVQDYHSEPPLSYGGKHRTLVRAHCLLGRLLSQPADTSGFVSVSENCRVGK